MGKIMDGYKKDLEEINEALEVETDKESIEILQDAKKQIEKNIADLETSLKTPKKVRAKSEPKKEKSEKKEKVEKPEKKKRSPRTYKPAPDKIKKTNMSGVDKLAVGESETDEDGNVVKRTATNTYILEYHKDPKDKVAFIKKGDKWLVDCCKKKGIEFKANEIQTAVEHIIEGLDCHYAIEERKEKAKARKKAREKYESQSDSEKMKNTIDSAAETVKNRVEDIKDSGKSISKTVGKEVVADISDIIEAISKGFKSKKDRNDFIKKLISELNKIMKSESFEDGGSVGDEIDLPSTNLILKGVGSDVNGNRVVKLMFINGASFSIQMTGNLPESKRILSGVKNISNISEKEIRKITEEIVDYIAEYGSKKQKQSLKTYGSFENK